MDLFVNAEMRGRLSDATSVKRFIEAGNATLTIMSLGSGTRFTFKFTRPEEEPGKARPIWVKLLNGPDNEGNYIFVGSLFSRQFGSLFDELKFSPKSKVGPEAPSVKALKWMLHHLYGLDCGGRPEVLFQQAELWHEGRCGRCGRKLTVPSSIASGFGPECAGRIGI